MNGPTPRYYFAPGYTWTSLDALMEWVEITSYVMSERGAGTSRGRSSELDDMRAGTGSFVLKNTDRRFDPTYTDGPYWQTTLNLTGASGSYAWTPDHAGLDVAGDIDLRVRVALDSITPAADSTLLGKWTTTGNQRSYRLMVTTTGTLALSHSGDGITGFNRASTVTLASVGIEAGQTVWLRGTLDVNNGAAGHDAKLWYSLDDTRDHTKVTWTQLGATVTTAGTVALFNSTALGEVGAQTIGTGQMTTGTVDAAAILNGIAGTVVADPVFSYGSNAGDSTVTDSTGKVWTVSSPASISSVGSYLKPGVPVKITGTANGTEYPVFRGFINGWPQDYDLSNKLAYVNVGCTDGMAKLATAGTPSSVYAIEVAADEPDGWWRLNEDAGDVAQDNSGNRNDADYRPGTTQLSTRSPNQWETEPAIGFDRENRRITAQGLSALVSARPFTVEFLVYITDPRGDDLDNIIFAYRGSSVGFGISLVNYSVTAPVGWKIEAYTLTPTLFANNITGTGALSRDGRGHHVAVVFPAAASAVIYIDGVNTSNVLGSHFIPFAPSGAVDIQGGWDSVGSSSGIVPVDVPAGDFAIYDSDLGATRIAAHAAAVTGPWDGDTTGARIDRILGFGWPSDLIDTATGFTTLGPATLGKNQLALIKGYEKAEQGRFFISRAGKATFLDRYYNQLVTAGNTSQATFSDDGSDNAYCSVAFDYDDRLVYNRIRASRSGGGDVEVLDQTSIDTYGEQVDSSLSGLDVPNDASVRGLAELKLDRYKDPALRVRPIELKLHGMTAAQQAGVLGLELGYRVTVERTPQGVGSAITQETVVEGISHRIAGGQWTTTLTLSPVDTRQYAIWGTTNWDDTAGWGY